MNSYIVFNFRVALFTTKDEIRPAKNETEKRPKSFPLSLHATNQIALLQITKQNHKSFTAISETGLNQSCCYLPLRISHLATIKQSPKMFRSHLQHQIGKHTQ